MNERHSSYGFTLIEVLAVLAIATLIMTLALPMFGTAFTPAKLDATAIRLATLFENERYAARRTGVSTVVDLSVAKHAIVVRRTKAVLTLPIAVKLGIEAVSRCADGDSLVIFYPDGRALSLIHI